MYNKLVFADKGSCTLFITCALCLLFTTVLHAESELWWDAHQSDYKSKRSMAIKFSHATRGKQLSDESI
jgi:hypothetical protein